MEERLLTGAHSCKPPPTPQMTTLLLIAGAALGANVHVRKSSMGQLCLDYAGATDTTPIKVAACVPNKATQQFGYNPSDGFIQLGGNPVCQEG